MKNVLITTLGFLKKHDSLEYYSYFDDNGEEQFCTGLSVAEAGTKYVLSTQKIDEILVVGSQDAIGDNEASEEKMLDVNTEYVSDISSLSEFGVFKYRIKQFIDNKDFEVDSIINGATEDFVKDVVAQLTKFKQEENIDFDGTHFRDVALYKEPYYSVFCRLKDKVPQEQFTYQCTVAYSKLDSHYKMYPIESNKNVSVKFVPLKQTETGRIDDNYEEVISNLMHMRNDDVRLYIDLQGFGFGEAFSLYNMISIYSKSTENRVELAGVIQSSFDPTRPINSIKNEWERFEIQRLLTGINTFLNYGRSSEICDYWEERKEGLPAAVHIIEGIKYVDEGVTFCNIPIIKYGISVIREALKEGNEIENTAFALMKDLIKKDYGELLEGDSVSIPALLKWTIDKKMYQQALTIIESHLPEDMVERGIFYYAINQKDIDNVKKELNVLFWNESFKNRFFFNDIDHYMLKSYGRNFIDNRQRKDIVEKDLANCCIRRIHGKVEGALPAYSDLNNDEMLAELISSYMSIGNLRNMVCHADAPKTTDPNGTTVKPESNNEIIKKALTRFSSMYSSICGAMRNEGYVPVRLSGDEFRYYTSMHRLEPLQIVEGQVLEQNIMCNFNGKDVSINIKMLAPEED